MALPPTRFRGRSLAALRRAIDECRAERRIHKTPAQQEIAACMDWLVAAPPRARPLRRRPAPRPRGAAR